MRAVFKIFFVIALLSLAHPSYAASDAEPLVWSSVDRKDVLVGDRIRLKIEVDTSDKVEIQFPKFTDDKIGIFEIKDSTSETKEGLFGKRVFIHRYVIAAYTLGKQTIPRIEIKYKYKHAKDWVKVRTNTVEINIRSVLPAAGASDIKDIKGPFDIFRINWIVVSVFVVLISLASAIFFFYMKRRNAKPLKLPHETALEELQAIRAAYARGEEVREYYAGISDCVRRYIERVFKLKAPEMTTEEFLNSLKGSGSLTLEQKDLLKSFLNACDLVKFAKYAPSSTEAETVFLTASKFVEETKNVHI